MIDMIFFTQSTIQNLSIQQRNVYYYRSFADHYLKDDNSLKPFHTNNYHHSHTQIVNNNYKFMPIET